MAIIYVNEGTLLQSGKFVGIVLSLLFLGHMEYFKTKIYLLTLTHSVLLVSLILALVNAIGEPAPAAICCTNA